MYGLVEGEDGGGVWAGGLVRQGRWVGAVEGRTIVLTADLCCKLDEFQGVELVFDRMDKAGQGVISLPIVPGYPTAAYLS